MWPAIHLLPADARKLQTTRLACRAAGKPRRNFEGHETRLNVCRRLGKRDGLHVIFGISP
jgi:hypothetical protein